jgi:Trypsin-like peptidase domain
VLRGDEVAVAIGGEVVEGRVLGADPDLDVAVLAVPGLGLPSLAFDRTAQARQPGAVLGYPQDGPYDVQGARIRERQRLRSPDIYGEGTVLREVFSVRSEVRPGNSGGPLVSTAGRVTGVVFATACVASLAAYAGYGNVCVHHDGADACLGRETEFVVYLVLSLGGLVAAGLALHFAFRGPRRAFVALLAVALGLYGVSLLFADAGTHGWDNLKLFPSLGQD